MKRRELAWATCVLAVWGGSAAAGKYAAMDEVKVEGGELRLAQPLVERGGPGDPPAAPAIAFPLRHTDVDLDVSGPMARVKVEQLFENPFDQPLEAVYVFPLNEGAAVNEYEIVVGDRTIRGQIDTREAARQRYEKARDEGRTAGLLEQQQRNVFSQSVANIPPHQPVRVRFSYVEGIEHRDGGYQLVFPMVVGPRYLPAGTSDPRAVGAHPAGSPPPPGALSVPYLPPGQRSGHDISLRARIDAGVPLTALASPSHQIARRRLDDTAVEVSLAPGDTIPNRDFVLRYSGAGDATLVGLLTHRQNQDGYFTLVVQPKAKYRAGDIAPRELVLVIDRSGSMDGRPLEQARALARALVSTATARDALNVITFADGVDSFAPSPVVASEENRRRALAWIDAIQAGGGTELGRGIGASLVRQPGADRVRMVYLLSDGFVGNDDEIVGAVQRTLGINRIFPVGVGSSTNRSLLDRLGRIGRGFTSYLLLADSPDELAAQLVRRTAYPYLTDVKVDWGGLEVAEVTPARIPDVYAGMPIVVSGRYRRPGKAKVRVEATVGGQRVATPLDVELPERDERPAVAYLWARARLRELEDGDGDPRKAITELGLAFHMVTAYTSFVAVDEQRVAAADGQLRTVLQPVELPDGVGWQGIFGEDDGSAASASGAAPAQLASSGHGSSARGSHGGGRSWGGGGGGAIDPFTLLTIAGFVPLARALRRRKRS